MKVNKTMIGIGIFLLICLVCFIIYLAIIFFTTPKNTSIPVSNIPINNYQPIVTNTISTPIITNTISTPIISDIPIIQGDISLKATNDKYCTYEDNGIVCNKDAVGESERFIIGTTEDNYIYIKGGKNGNYCSDEGDKIICIRDNIQYWEKFKIENLFKNQTAENNYVAIRGGKNNKYCSLNKDNKIICNSSYIGNNEKFKINKALSILDTLGLFNKPTVSNMLSLFDKSTSTPNSTNIPIIQGTITLEANNKYCTYEGDKIICNKISNTIEESDRFYIETIEDNYISIKKGDDKYCSDDGDKIICNKNNIGEWEKFKIENLFKNQTVENNYVAIRGGKNNAYCTVNEDSKIICNSVHIGNNETFKIKKAFTIRDFLN